MGELRKLWENLCSWLQTIVQFSMPLSNLSHWFGRGKAAVPLLPFPKVPSSFNRLHTNHDSLLIYQPLQSYKLQYLSVLQKPNKIYESSFWRGWNTRSCFYLNFIRFSKVVLPLLLRLAKKTWRKVYYSRIKKLFRSSVTADTWCLLKLHLQSFHFLQDNPIRHKRHMHIDALWITDYPWDCLTSQTFEITE